MFNQSLPDAEALQQILSYLDCNDRDLWFKTFAILGRAYHCDERVLAIAQNWARKCSSRKENDDAKKERTEFYHSSQRQGPGIGALIAEAKRHGYKATTYDSFVHEHEAPNSAMVMGDVGISIREAEVTPESPQGALLGAAQKAANRALRFWIYYALPDENAERRRFLNENRKYFKFLPRDHRLMAAALTDYCNTHDTYGPQDFSEWCESHSLSEVPKLMQKVNITDSIPECAEHTWDLIQDAYQAGWRLLAMQRAQDLVFELQDLSIPFEGTDKLVNHFVKEVAKASEYEVLDVQDWAPRARNAVMDFIDLSSNIRTFIPTGYDAIDRHILGYRRGEVTIFAAHSGVGKTWFGVDSSLKVAIERKARVLFVSTEMSTDAVLMRYFSCMNGVNLDRKTLSDLNEQGKLTAAFQHTAKVCVDAEFMRIQGNVMGGLSIDQIESAVADASTVQPVDLVVVDYLQNVINDNLGRNASGFDRNKDTMGRLDRIARRFNCAVLALAQLNNPNRKVSANQAPNLYDIAECTYVVQPAAAVLMMYKVNLDALRGSKKPEDKGTILNLSVVKSRYGTNTDAPLTVIRKNGSNFDFFAG